MASGPAQFDKIRLGIRHPALVLQRARTRGATRSHPTEGSLAATRGSGAARAHQVHRVLHAPLGRAQADVRVPRDVDALRAHVRPLQEHCAPAAPGARQPRGRFDKKLFLTRGPPGRAFNSERLPARSRRWRLETSSAGTSGRARHQGRERAAAGNITAAPLCGAAALRPRTRGQGRATRARTWGAARAAVRTRAEQAATPADSPQPRRPALRGAPRTCG